jgi:hypothetical protein
MLYIVGISDRKNLFCNKKNIGLKKIITFAPWKNLAACNHKKKC